MNATNMYYDGESLRDYNCIICQFDSNGGITTVSAGSNINFTTVKPVGSDHWGLHGTAYSDPVSAKIQICKVTDTCIPLPMTMNEESRIMRWLNRKDGFHDFQIEMEGYEDVTFQGSFNLEKVQVNGITYGFTLTFTGNRPYGLLSERTLRFTTTANSTFMIFDNSDETGDTYPTVTIKCLQAGDLTISHSMNPGHDVEITGCKLNEIITLKGEYKLPPETTSSTHNIANAFNYEWLKITNKYRERKNVYTVSLPCEITIKYKPARKVSV